MEKYRWNLLEIKLKLLISKIMRNELMISSYEDMVNFYDITKSKSKLTILNEEAFDTSNIFDYFMNIYTSDMESIEKEFKKPLYDLSLKYGGDELSYTEYKLKNLNLSDDGLVSLTYDIIKSMGDKNFIKIFDKLLKGKKINIQNMTENNVISDTYFYEGTTYLDYFSDKSYINLFKRNNIMDVSTLTHEVMHAIFNVFADDLDDKTRLEKYNFRELEGYFADYYSSLYLKNIKEFEEEAKLIPFQDLRTTMITLAHLNIAERLYKMLSTNSYDINMLNQYTQDTFDIKIEESGIKLITINKMYELYGIIDYLTSLEIIKANEDPTKQVHLLKLLKSDPLIKEYELLNKYNLNFINNNFDNYNKEVENIKKILLTK